MRIFYAELFFFFFIDVRRMFLFSRRFIEMFLNRTFRNNQYSVLFVFIVNLTHPAISKMKRV